MTAPRIINKEHKMIYDKRINERNIKTFNRYKTSFPSAYLFNCVLCKEACCIDNSCSNQGARMICSKCFANKFETIDEAFDFVLIGGAE